MLFFFLHPDPFYTTFHFPILPPLLQTLVTVVHTLDWSDWEPSTISAVVIDHVVVLNPNQLVVLVDVKLGQHRLIPPVLRVSIAAALLGVIGSSHRNRALTGIDVKAFVRCNKGSMGPIGLDPPALCGPVVGVPD